MRQSTSITGSVRLLVCNAFVRRSTRRTLLAYLALLFNGFPSPPLSMQNRTPPTMPSSDSNRKPTNSVGEYAANAVGPGWTLPEGVEVSLFASQRGRAHGSQFFFLDIGLVVGDLYGCICQSIRVFTWANFQVNCNNFFLKTKGFQIDKARNRSTLMNWLLGQS